MRKIDLAIYVEAYLHGSCERLAPRQLIRVVFIGTDEHDGLCLFQDLIVQQAAKVLARRRCQGYANDLLQLVDGARRARTASDDATLGPGVDRILDGLLRLMQQLAHTAPGDVVLGVRVGVNTL